MTAYLSKTFSNSPTENLKTVLHLSTAPSLSFSHPFNQSLSLPLSFFLSSLRLSLFPFLYPVLSQIIFSLSLSLSLSLTLSVPVSAHSKTLFLSPSTSLFPLFHTHTHLLYPISLFLFPSLFLLISRCPLSLSVLLSRCLSSFLFLFLPLSLNFSLKFSISSLSFYISFSFSVSHSHSLPRQREIKNISSLPSFAHTDSRYPLSLSICVSLCLCQSLSTIHFFLCDRSHMFFYLSFFSFSRQFSRTYTNTHTHTHKHTNTLFLSLPVYHILLSLTLSCIHYLSFLPLSLVFTHTHTHTNTLTLSLMVYHILLSLTLSCLHYLSFFSLSNLHTNTHTSTNLISNKRFISYKYASFLSILLPSLSKSLPSPFSFSLLSLSHFFLFLTSFSFSLLSLSHCLSHLFLISFSTCSELLVFNFYHSLSIVHTLIPPLTAKPVL